VTILAMIDGQIVPPEHARVSVFDRGFLFGDSVFETIRTYGGVPFALDEHIERLARSAARVYINLPVATETIRAEVLRVVAEAGNDESFIRVMVTRGHGEIALPPQVASHPVRVVLVTPLVAPPDEAYSRGVSVLAYRTQRVADSTDAVGAKVANYLVSVLAMRDARRVGAVEALIVDGNGCVVEGATSNVFAVIDGQLVTPPEDAGILLGITRATLLDVARSEGMAPVLRPLPLEELMAAEEVFISSSIRELLPVVRIDDSPIGSGEPGPVSQRLLNAFRKKINQIMEL
jgi:branched-chain amino acid aminotransferase